MALVAFNNALGIVLTPLGAYPYTYNLTTNPVQTTSTTLNAAGESLCYVGRLYLTSGPGTSKTISSAGGKIWVQVATVTWAAAGTTLRVGLQDINTSTGLEDGTYDVYDDLVQGTDALASNTVKEVTLSSGTKTITHGDLVGVIVEMTVRLGADAVGVPAQGLSMNFPYKTEDIGTGPAKAATTAGPICVVQCDDGTIGHFGEWTIPITETVPSFNATASPDEYATIFRLPFAGTVNGLFLRIADIDTGDDATVYLIADPLGTPTVLESVALTPPLQANIGTNTAYTMVDIPVTAVAANTDYAVAYRATSTGLRGVRLLTLPSAAVRAALPLLVSGATRTDAGAFTQSLTVIPDFGVRVSQIETDGGGGGGGTPRSVAYVG